MLERYAGRLNDPLVDERTESVFSGHDREPPERSVPRAVAELDFGSRAVGQLDLGVLSVECISEAPCVLLTQFGRDGDCARLEPYRVVVLEDGAVDRIDECGQLCGGFVDVLGREAVLDCERGERGPPAVVDRQGRRPCVLGSDGEDVDARLAHAGQPVAGTRSSSDPIAPSTGAISTSTVPQTATNVGGSVTATSASTNGVKPVPAPPANSALPVISGTARRFETLSATAGLWTGGVNAFAYQWLRCATAGGGDCASVAGATGSNYVLTLADVGSTMRIQVTATNGVGPTTVASAPSAVVKQGVIEARLEITPSNGGGPTSGYTCTGLSVRIDGSGSVSPDGISSYSISEVSLSAAAYEVYEVGAAFGADDNVLAFEDGDMPEGEIQSRIIATFHQPTVITTFGWSRMELPLDRSDPNGYQNFAVDPVGILFTVTDFAGATATAIGVIHFAQYYSNESRAHCPPSAGLRPGTIPRLTSVVPLLQQASVAYTAAGKPSAIGTKLSCAQPVTCRGAISIGLLSASAAAQHRHKAPVVLARSFFAIAPHHRLTVRAPLTRAGARYIASLRPGTARRLALTIINVGPTGKQLTRRSTIAVTKPRHQTNRSRARGGRRRARRRLFTGRRAFLDLVELGASRRCSSLARKAGRALSLGSRTSADVWLLLRRRAAAHLAGSGAVQFPSRRFAAAGWRQPRPRTVATQERSSDARALVLDRRGCFTVFHWLGCDCCSFVDAAVFGGLRRCR